MGLMSRGNNDVKCIESSVRFEMRYIRMYHYYYYSTVNSRLTLIYSSTSKSTHPCASTSMIWDTLFQPNPTKRTSYRGQSFLMTMYGSKSGSHCTFKTQTTTSDISISDRPIHAAGFDTRVSTKETFATKVGLASGLVHCFML